VFAKLSSLEYYDEGASGWRVEHEERIRGVILQIVGLPSVAPEARTATAMQPSERHVIAEHS